MMDITEKISAALCSALGSEPGITWRRSAKGVISGWCAIDNAAALVPMAKAVAALEGRLSAVTGYVGAIDENRGSREVAYHFDLDGTTLTITLTLPLSGATVPSLFSLFRNAQWCERELMELYEVTVTDHPDPRRLFIDESIEPAVFERLIPYSSFINGASSKNLFESVLRREEKEGVR